VSKKKDLNIGIVGYGFMGRTHSNAFLQAPRFFDLPYRPVLKAVCARNADRVKGFADNWGYQSIETDWRVLVERKDIDVIDIASPNDTHASIAIAAAQAGKMVMCEKPLGRTAVEAASMVHAVESAKVPNMVWYNYRRVPAVVMLKKLLEEDRFGRIFHYRSQFLQDWTISQDLPQGGEGLWRLDSSVAGSGVTGDLLAHNIDMAMWLNGPITEVSAMTETFIKERKHNLTGKVEPVKITMPARFCAASRTDRWRCLRRRAMRAGTRRCLRWRSTASALQRHGICTICTGSNTSTTAMKANCAGGRASTSPTGTTLT
jgi:predicted dehydrogenase